MSKVAAYERLSKEDLPDEGGVSTLQRQRDTIDHWARQNGHHVAHYFRDAAGRRHQADDPKRRPEYARLMADIRQGKWDILVVEELTRLGFVDQWALMAVCAELRSLGVTIIEAKSNRVVNGDSVADGILSLVGGHASAKEVEQTATRSLGAKIAKARDQGAHLGGKVPYGLMQECRADAEVRWTMEEAPDGRKVQEYPDGTVVWHEAGYLPGRRPGEYIVLIPSRRYLERANFVRLAADLFLTQRISFGGIAKRLNDLGAYPPGGTPWYSAKIQSLLLLSGGSYTGFATFAKRGGGRYVQASGGRPGAAVKPALRADEDWVWSKTPNFEPPIISREDFAAIRAKAAAEKGGPRRGKNQDLILSGLVYCGGCGSRMAGSAISRKGRPVKLIYQCSENLRHHGHPPSGCHANQVPQETLLGYVDRWLAETGAVLGEDPDGSEEALLVALYGQQSRAREGLREAREAAESWLAEALLAVCDPEPVRDGRRRFRLGEWDLTLPGCRSHADFLDALGWVSGSAGAKDRARLAELQGEHDRLFQALIAMPTEMMREKCLTEVRRVEAEMGKLKSSPGVAARLKELARELSQTARLVTVARRAAAKGTLARRGKAIADVIERIELSHRLEPRALGSKQVVSRLERRPDRAEGLLKRRKRPGGCLLKLGAIRNARTPLGLRASMARSGRSARGSTIAVPTNRSGWSLIMSSM